jgi:hypothetical protein
MIIFRILIGAVGLLVVGHQTYHIYGEFTGPYEKSWLFWPFNGAIITLGFLALWYALAGPQDLNKIGRVLIAGLIAGGVGLVGGVAYALVAPLLRGQSPGGLFPIIGIFMTGPAGFVLGCMGAFLWYKALWRTAES